MPSPAVQSLALLLATLLVSASVTAAAQPSDAVIRRDVMGPGILSIRFAPGRNQPTIVRVGVIEFMRGVTVVRHSELPGIDLEVFGQALYNSTDGRRWTFIRMMVTSNRYLGIPDPTESEITAVLQTNPEMFFGGGAARVAGRPTQAPTLAPEPVFNWYTPNSVSFPMVVEFDRLDSGAVPKVTRVRATYEVRLYRDDMNAPWRSTFASTPRGEPEVLSERPVTRTVFDCITTLFELTHGEPERSVQSCLDGETRQAESQAARAGSAEERASFRVGARASTPLAPALANFRDATGPIDLVHAALLTGDRVAVETLLRSVVGERYLQGAGVLNEAGIDLVSNALFEAFSEHGAYREQFCRPLLTDTAHSPPNGLMLVGRIEGTSALIVFERSGPQWFLARLDLTVRHDPDGIAAAAAAPACPR